MNMPMRYCDVEDLAYMLDTARETNDAEYAREILAELARRDSYLIEEPTSPSSGPA